MCRPAGTVLGYATPCPYSSRAKCKPFIRRRLSLAPSVLPLHAFNKKPAASLRRAWKLPMLERKPGTQLPVSRQLLGGRLTK
jgi:hypothetical protein